MRKNVVSKRGVSNALRGKIRAKIDVPGISVDIDTIDSPAALRELRKILDSVKVTGPSPFEGDFDEISVEYAQKNALWNLSEEARSNEEFMEFIKLASKAEEQVAYKRLSIANKRVIDVLQKKVFATIDVDKAKTNVRSALNALKLDDVRFAAVHVMGNIPDEEKSNIVDIMSEQLGRSEVKKSFTTKDVLGKTIVEVLLFGKCKDDALN